MMESVEDVPRDATLDGLPWDWTTDGQYPGWIDRIPKGIDVGGMVGHSAVRLAAMGDRSMDEAPATADDVDAICRLVDESIGARPATATPSSTARSSWTTASTPEPSPASRSGPDPHTSPGEAS